MAGRVCETKLRSPENTGVITWVPNESAEVAKVAWPEPSSVPDPSTVAPSLNVTVPVGVPDPAMLAATTPVKVTLCDKSDGFAELEEVPVVPARFNRILTFPPLLATTRSRAPSLLKSAAAMELGKEPAAYRVCGLKVPSPLPRSTLTSLL